MLDCFVDRVIFGRRCDVKVEVFRVFVLLGKFCKGSLKEIHQMNRQEFSRCRSVVSVKETNAKHEWTVMDSR
ncbi:protein phophatase 2c family protein [Moniliophthora roreri]|nr:protein phophatase 2c family protein [Moniliophthora roreri]